MSGGVTVKVTVENELGLHARPAALFVQTASRYESTVSVEKEGQKVDGKSVMGIMMLAAQQGTRLVIRAHGADAREAVDALAKLTRERFGEQ